MRPATLAVIMLGCWVGAPCAAQTPAAAPAPVPPASVVTQAGRPLPPPLTSSVSPAIERFMKQSGRDLGPPSAPAAAGAVAGRAIQVPARPAPTPPPAVNRSPAQGVQDAPAALPSRPAPADRSPLDTTLRLKPAPLQPTDLRFPINLATALRLSDARPLVVAAAQARVWAAEAELAQAKVLWIPDLVIAFDYLRHDGGGPDFNKGIMTAPSTNFFYGGGGLSGIISTTDAIYQPLVARQILNARHWDIQSSKNDAQLETADAYFMVHQYRGMYASTLYLVERGHELVEKISTLSRDLVREFEVDRARNMVADLEQQAVAARQQWRVQSARLTKVLRLDPRAVIAPQEPDHLQVTMIDPARGFDDLMPVALNNRPELAARQALVQAAEARVRQEKARPLLPLVVLTGFQSPGGMLIQGGIFGLGYNSNLNQWNGRDDVSIQLMWQLQNVGFGNLAQIKKQRGQESRAIVDLRKTQDRVAAEVNQTLARVQSAAARVTQANRSLRAGFIALNGAVEGLSQTSRFGDVLNLISRPQEAVYALQLLKKSFNEYFMTVAEYNRAQFELFHALGYPASEVALRNTPGAVLPVDTSRPNYLPPVAAGPPPATR